MSVNSFPRLYAIAKHQSKTLLPSSGKFVKTAPLPLEEALELTAWLAKAGCSSIMVVPVGDYWSVSWSTVRSNTSHDSALSMTTGDVSD